MSKLERLVIGGVINLILMVVFVVLVWRTKTVRPTTVSNIPPLPTINLDLLKPKFTDQLNELEVNGNLPVTVADAETHGEGRNPFE